MKFQGVFPALLVLSFLTAAAGAVKDPVDLDSEPPSKWFFRTGGAVTAAPALKKDGKTLYVGSADRYFYAIDTETGTTNWSLKFPAAITAAATVGEDGTLYVPCANGRLYALTDDGTAGVFKWPFPFRAQRTGISSPVVGEDGTVYVGSSDNRLYALFPDGARKWAFNAKDNVGTPLIATQRTNELDTLYVQAGRNIFGVTFAGAQSSVFSPGSGIHSTPAVGDDGTIFFGADNDVVYALKEGGTTNTVRWRVNTRKKVTSSPVIGVTGNIYIASETARLYAFTTNGALLWNVSTKKPVHSALSIGADGTIYAGSDDKRMYAISAEGTVRWTKTTRGTVHSAAAIDGKGTVYFGSSDHFIYAVEDDTYTNAEDTGDDAAENVWPMFRRDQRHTARSIHGEPFVVQTPVGVGATNGQRSFDLTNGEDSLTFRLVGGATANVLVSVGARAGAPLSYQWSRDGAAIDPAVNPTAARATLVLTNVQFSDAGRYTVEVSNEFGSIDSADLVSGEFLLNIDASPALTTSVTNQFLLEGNRLELNVGATGSEPLFYQWNFNGAPIQTSDNPTARNATFVISNAQRTNAGTYSVSVINAVGNTNSARITVAIFARPPALTNTLAAGARHSLAVLEDGTLWSWGLDNFGQLGDALHDSTGASSTTPIFGGIPELIGLAGAGRTNAVWSSVTAGSRGYDFSSTQPGGFSLGIQTNGTLWAWGLNNFGQLGLGSVVSPIDVPVRVGSDSNWFQVEAGATHTLALKRDGTLWAWGANSSGQLGLGTTFSSNAPARVGAESAWVEVRAGGFFSLARRADGSIWAWGLNSSGQLGLGTKYNSTNAPARIGTNADWASISAGVTHSLGLKTNGTLWSWGAGSFGQLGLGTNSTSQRSPVPVGTNSNWSFLEAGSYHSFALQTNGVSPGGALFAWGANWFGQLGNGASGSLVNTNDANGLSPGPVGTNAWLDLDASTHSLGLTVDGGVWAWGFNSHGQRGNGTTASTNSPVQVVFTNVVFTSSTSAPPTIGVAPMSLTKLVGSTAAFSITATGAPPIYYQWFFNSNALAASVNFAVTNATLTLSNVVSGNAGYYYAVVTNGFGRATSAVASLTITDTNGITSLPNGTFTTNGIAPQITLQPTNHAALTNTPTTFVVMSVGTPALLYQWRFNGGVISSAGNSSATNAGLILARVQATNAGSYDVIVMNNYGSVTSRVALLTVTNSSGVNVTNSAPVITHQPGSQTANEGDTASFTVAATGSPAVAYQWYFSGQPIDSATNATAAQAVLSLPNVQGNTAGYYHVVVTNSLGSVTSAVVSLTVTNSAGQVFLPYQTNANGGFIVVSPPFFAQQPTNQTMPPGSAVSLVSSANGAPTIAYHWRFNSTNIDTAGNGSATSPTLMISTAQASDAGLYDVVAVNAYGSVTSDVVRLTVTNGASLAPPAKSAAPGAIHLSSLGVTAKGAVLRVTGADSAGNYLLEFKDALSDPVWTPVSTNRGPLTTILDSTLSIGHSRFYRLRAE